MRAAHTKGHALLEGEMKVHGNLRRFGDHIAKFSVVPVSASLTAHTKEKIDTANRPDAVRAEVADVMTRNDGV